MSIHFKQSCRHFFNVIILSILGSSVASAQFSDPRAPVGDSSVTVPGVVRPILDYWMRDTYITRGPDNMYYMTGTLTAGVNFNKGVIPFDNKQKGIYLWRSPDLKNWTPMGCVWNKQKDGTWQKDYRPVRGEDWESQLPDSAYRGVWAPELHYIKSKKQWLIIACNSHGGSFILKSTSGIPGGPYVNIEGNKDGVILDQIDGSLFEDDNGDVYLVGHNHYIARMKDDLSGLAEPFKRFKETPYKPEPYLEGVYMVKHHGKYQLLQTVWSIHNPDGSYSFLRPKNSIQHSYDVVVAEADNIYGPYGPRYPAIMEGGHNNLFTDKNGQWWSTTFFNPKGEMGKAFPVTCRPAVVAVKWENGKLMPDINRNKQFYSTK